MIEVIAEKESERHEYFELLRIMFPELEDSEENIILRAGNIASIEFLDKVLYLNERLNENNATEFSELMCECECKIECVVTFLAMLEMIKQRLIKVYQNTNFGEILIERRNDNE